jgi:hypothetical protein
VRVVLTAAVASTRVQTSCLPVVLTLCLSLLILCTHMQVG